MTLFSNDDAIFRTVSEGDLEIVQRMINGLVTEGENLATLVSMDQSTCLHLAIEYGHPTLAQWLAKKCPASVFAKNNAKETPLLVAVNKVNR